MRGSKDLSTTDSSKANVKPIDGQNIDKDALSVYSIDNIQYPALKKPQGPSMFTLDQSYISKQTKNKALVRQFNQAAEIKLCSATPLKTFSKLRHDMYNSSERAYRAKRKLAAANQMGVQKNAGKVGNHGAPSGAKKGKHPRRRSLTAAIINLSRKQMNRMKAEISPCPWLMCIQKVTSH